MFYNKAIGATASAQKIYIESVFSTYLYTGNGSTQTITNEIDLSGQGGLVWIKNRSSDISHVLQDTARGVNQVLLSNSTGAQFSSPSINFSFLNNGFSQNNNFADFNSSGNTYVSWTFRKAAKFFDVVTYTGTGANRTIAHNLGSVPGCIIIKRLNAAAGWVVYHRSLANTEYLVLNTQATKATGATYWNSTTATSSVFSLGTAAAVNASGDTYVAYIFAHNAGGFGLAGTDDVITCGSYTTDSGGNATVTLGWEPQFVIIKEATAAGSYGWITLDTFRGWDLESIDKVLYADNGAGESTFGGGNPTATGFVSPTLFGTSTYVYIAIRRGPMKTPTDATKVFTSITKTSGSGQINTSDFPVDLSIDEGRSTNYGATWFDRLRGRGPYLLSSSTNAEANQDPTYYVGFDSNTGVFNKNYGGLGGGTYVNWLFRRAPGFFDVVAYAGNSVAGRTLNHNLGVSPELMIIKSRSNAVSWFVYSAALGANYDLILNSSNASSTPSNAWNNTSPTSSVLTLGTDSAVNLSGRTYIAYLFATCPGVSKVGSYTGSGGSNAISVDCGFTNGARFVLIKRTDSTGDWYVWDTARGIVSGNDPYLLLNSTAAEVANEDYIDPYPAGFEISPSAPFALRGSSFTTGTFIYLAIA